jgi:hypothetical protein
VIATLASQVAVSSTSKGNSSKDEGQKPKDRGGRQGSGRKPPQKASVNAVTQQAALRQQLRQQMPCHLEANLCTEAHLLERCQQFKMSPEQRVVRVNELQLCQVCMKHPADRECYTKGKADFKGCIEGGCGMLHHPLLQWALIAARLFQVQVAAESFPPSTQIFQLRQQVKMDKVEVGLAFDSGRSHTVVTKEFAESRKLKKVGSGVPVIGFGSPDVEVGDVFKELLKSSGKKSITVNVVVMESIYNSPPTKCLHSVT